MTADPNRKTLRHFYCRDALWHSFERMSEDLDRGIDELVNEAMRVFAREKGYLPTESDSPRVSGRTNPPPPPAPRRLTPPPPPAPSMRNTASFGGRPAYGGGAPSSLPSPTLSGTGESSGVEGAAAP